MIVSENLDQVALKIQSEDIAKLPLFRLKRLSFDQELEMLPLNVDKECLEHLDLSGPLINYHRDMLLKSFKNVRHLTANYISDHDSYLTFLSDIFPEIR